MAQAKPRGDGRIDTHVYLEPDLLESIRRVAESNERSISAQIRLTLRQAYLARPLPA